MEYRLGVDGGPDAIAAGTGVLLRHPSTADTDRIDSQFLGGDTDRFLVISTRTTAHEVEQKLEFFDIDQRRATIIDAISIERGYSRRQVDNVRYLPSPSNTDALVDAVEEFLAGDDGKLRISFDSVTELAFYAGTTPTVEAIGAIVELLEAYDAVGLFHLAEGVHDERFVEAVSDHFEIVIEIDDDGGVTVSM